MTKEQGGALLGGAEQDAAAPPVAGQGLAFSARAVGRWVVPEQLGLVAEEKVAWVVSALRREEEWLVRQWEPADVVVEERSRAVSERPAQDSVQPEPPERGRLVRRVEVWGRGQQVLRLLARAISLVAGPVAVSGHYPPVAAAD